ncbi:hypothetical protein WA026_010536 [Henosepilachna vigintioctopunctata]|uniref:Uncharacterized protein n=1 Tax=Henosepilachna vigintioctopunctata TaxID=420089 RepID=A0AAW1VEA4_9CUCU
MGEPYQTVFHCVNNELDEDILRATVSNPLSRKHCEGCSSRKACKYIIMSIEVIVSKRQRRQRLRPRYACLFIIVAHMANDDRQKVCRCAPCNSKTGCGDTPMREHHQVQPRVTIPMCPNC